MGATSSVNNKDFKGEKNTTSKDNNQKKSILIPSQIVQNDKNILKSQMKIDSERKSVNNHSRDGDSQDQDDKDSLKQHNLKYQKQSLSDINDDQNIQSKQELNSKADLKGTQFHGPRYLAKQNSYRSPSFIQFQKEHFYNHKSAQPSQPEKRLFGDFYTGNPQTTSDKKTPTYMIHNNNEDPATTQNKDDQQKKKDLQQNQIKEKKSVIIESETRNIVEIKEKSQGFFAKGNVVLAVNQFSNYNNEKIQNQEEHQTQLLKQLVELGIKPTQYILNNQIKMEYEEKKNQLSKYEDYGAKNQRSKNAQKVQIITYPGFQEILQNKGTPKQSQQQQQHQLQKSS